MESKKDFKNISQEILLIKKKCKCCGKLTLDRDELFGICSNCGWQSDYVQENDPDYKGGANEMSLNEAKRAYKEGRKIE